MKKIKTNIQSKKFYREANDMQDGWGDNLRSIDELKDKVDTNQDITISEACYVLWAERSINSDLYLKFKDSLIAFHDRKMPYPAWNGMFEDWFLSNNRGSV